MVVSMRENSRHEFVLLSPNSFFVPSFIILPPFHSRTKSGNRGRKRQEENGQERWHKLTVIY